MNRAERDNLLTQTESSSPERALVQYLRCTRPQSPFHLPSIIEHRISPHSLSPCTHITRTKASAVLYALASWSLLDLFLCTTGKLGVSFAPPIDPC